MIMEIIIVVKMTKKVVLSIVRFAKSLNEEVQLGSDDDNDDNANRI